MEKIDVDIWSDIVCPFCYIGKRNFETALEQAGLKNSVNVTWHSFELAPDAVTKPDVDIYEELAARKGWSVEQSRQIHKQMEERAKDAGLEYNFDKTIPANSKKAHKLLHLAKKHQVQYAVKESLFKAYFTDGKNIDDEQTLIQIGREAGLAEADITEALASEKIEMDVLNDIQEAAKIGIQGVPFFVFEHKYGVSGAQPVQVFKDVLKKMSEELAVQPEPENPAACTPEGDCS